MLTHARAAMQSFKYTFAELGVAAKSGDRIWGLPRDIALLSVLQTTAKIWTRVIVCSKVQSRSVIGVQHMHT